MKEAYSIWQLKNKKYLHMKTPISLIIIFFFILCTPLAAQTPEFEELDFEQDSTTKTYKPAGKNYAFIRSKRGTGGLTKNSRADSIKSLTIPEIILVYSELNKSAIDERETANNERWQNLLKTYPEFFQFSTTYKSVCQCNTKGDSTAFKQAQGFYVYFGTMEEPKVEEKKVEEKKVTVTKVEEKQKEDKKKEDKKKVKEDKKDSDSDKETAKTEKKNDKKKEKAEKEKKEPEVKVTETKEADIEPVTEVKPKKVGYAKPKRAKDPKACRPPCYENGDEDLNNFFVTNIKLTKKQRKHGKDLVSVLKLQLNFDGSIKKSLITGEDETLNQQVTDAIKNMNLWNPAVKGGLTVKSEVKITLKYDRETKGMKPFEVAIIPRPAPKCKCMSDAELFGE
jgi:hypothetical protein